MYCCSVALNAGALCYTTALGSTSLSPPLPNVDIVFSAMKLNPTDIQLLVQREH